MMENGRLDFRGLLLLALLPPLPRRGRGLSGPEAPPRFFGVLLQLLPAFAERGVAEGRIRPRLTSFQHVGIEHPVRGHQRDRATVFVGTHLDHLNVLPRPYERQEVIAGLRAALLLQLWGVYAVEPDF